MTENFANLFECLIIPQQNNYVVFPVGRRGLLWLWGHFNMNSLAHMFKSPKWLAIKVMHKCFYLRICLSGISIHFPKKQRERGKEREMWDMRNGKWGLPFGFGVESFTIRTRTRTQHETFVLTISKYTHKHTHTHSILEVKGGKLEEKKTK